MDGSKGLQLLLIYFEVLARTINKARDKPRFFMAPIVRIEDLSEYQNIVAYLTAGKCPANISSKQKYIFKAKANKFYLQDEELYFKEGEDRKLYIPHYKEDKARELAK